MKTRIAPAIRPLFAAGLSLGALAALPSLASAAGTAGDVTAGKKLFTADCQVCHKADGEGGVKLGSETSADLRALALEVMYHHDDKLLARAILDGKDEKNEALATVMPRWRGQLSAKQVNAVIAYLKTLHK